MTTKLKIYVILGALVLLVACQSLDEGSSDKNEDPTQPSVIEFDQISDENDLDQRDIRFVENCLPVKENILSNFLTTGTLLFNRQTSSDYNELWSISRHSDEPKLLPSIATATLSPQGNWLASYNWRDGNVLQIIGSDQVISIEHQWETQWQNGYGLRWLDENWLVIPSASSSPEKLTLYNPFLDQEKFVTTELPNIYVLQPSYQLDGFVLFNKQLSHVLYVATTREDGQMLILLDSEQNQELWHFASPNVRNFPVAWNADGNHLAVAGELESSENLDKFEVFLIDVHGKVKQITQFAEYYSHTSINTLSWSPDGKYIAFGQNIPRYLKMSRLIPFI